jgi:transposase InsO family protein
MLIILTLAKQCFLFDYIEIYYNQVRRHSANGWLSPEAFEQKYFKSLEGLFVHDTV